jgi:hypothetical protein
VKHRFRGGAACLVVDNQNINRNSGFFFLTCFIDGQVLVLRVVDLEIGSLLASTPDPTGEKQKHTGKENNIQSWHRCANKYDDMPKLMVLK